LALFYGIETKREPEAGVHQALSQTVSARRDNQSMAHPEKGSVVPGHLAHNCGDEQGLEALKDTFHRIVDAFKLRRASSRFPGCSGRD
jgi:isopentenyldiphosphate isomerase